MVLSEYVVVDASLAFKWLVDEGDSDQAGLLAEAWTSRGIRTTAPYFMIAEVANILLQRIKRGEIDVGESSRLIAELLDTGVQLHHSLGIHQRAVELATELGQGAVYDCHYLALAELLDCEMWTADERFFRSASPGYARLRLLSEFVAPEL